MSTGFGARGGRTLDSGGAGARYIARALIAALLSTMTMGHVTAQAQEHIALPPVNLGGTSFMDGVGGPGLLVRVGALQLVANAYGELAVENRPRGTRVNAVVMEVW
jgi:hypothetical protein